VLVPDAFISCYEGIRESNLQKRPGISGRKPIPELKVQIPRVVIECGIVGQVVVGPCGIAVGLKMIVQQEGNIIPCQGREDALKPTLEFRKPMMGRKKTLLPVRTVWKSTVSYQKLL